jgi:hypothetical protein
MEAYGIGLVRKRFTAQCIPCFARWLFGFIDKAFWRYSMLARGDETAASHNQGSSISGFMPAAMRAQYLVLE